VISESDIIERNDELHEVKGTWDEKERCRDRHIQNGNYRKKRQRRRETIDGATLWPNRRAGHNTSPLQKRCTPRASEENNIKHQVDQ
jgi:hypothetical protein